MQNPFFTRILGVFTGVLLLASVLMPAAPFRGSPERASTSPSAAVASDVRPASSRCFSTLPILERYLQDQFGLAPDAIRSIHEYATVREFFTEHLELSGTPSRRLSLDEFVALGLQQSRPAVVSGANGSLAVVTAVMPDDHNRPCVQILESEKTSRLLTPRHLRDAGFREVWIADTDLSETEIRIGNASATIDRVLLPVGLIMPSLDVESQFLITNTGDQPIVIGRIAPTCGCTAVEPHEDIKLAPGESQDFQVGVAAGDSGSCVQHVDLTLFAGGTGESRDVRVTVCGNVLDAFRISPSSLDFDKVDSFGDEPVVREVRLSQPESDPYEILLAEVDGVPLDVTWEQDEDAFGTSSQPVCVVTAALDPRQLKPGKHRGKIRLTTSSVRRPLAEIPFECEVRGAIQGVPDVVSFDMVPAGQSATEEIVINSRNGTLTQTSVSFCPPWISCNVSQRPDGTHLVLTAAADRVGKHFGKLRLNLNTDSGSEELVVSCYLTVQQAKGSNSQ